MQMISDTLKIYHFFFNFENKKKLFVWKYFFYSFEKKNMQMISDTLKIYTIFFFNLFV